MNKKQPITISRIIKVVFLLLILSACIYPFIYMVAVSFSDDIYVLKSQISFYPKGFTLKVYDIVFSDKRIFQAYGNTIIYTVVGTTIAMAITSAGGYAMCKKRIVFHRFFNIMIIVTMFFSGGLIPTFLTVRYLGLLDSIWAIVLPTCVSAWNFILMRSFFDNFPTDIEESGRIEGLNDIQIFIHLVLPVSKAVTMTIGLFYAVAIWNAYFYPFIYLSSPEKLPLQVILREILMAGSNSNEATGVGDSTVVEESLKYATVLVSVVPVIAIYPFIQKYFVKGVMIGSVKG
ncbi:MAG: carbohydrate ABC transporter permease [Spirochaetaceae bacterium]